MKRTLLACLAVGASVLVAPAAHAAVPNVLHGGCFVDTDGHPLVTGDTQVGVIGDLSVTTTGDLPPMPIGATVTCSIEVNGVVVPAATHSYGDSRVPGIQGGTDPVTYTASPFDTVDLCQSVVFADNTTSDECVVLGDNIQIPPQAVIDAVDAIYDALIGVVDPIELEALEPLVCPPLGSISGTYGLVIIGPDGDLSVVDPLVGKSVLLVDCPPHRLSVGG